MSEVLAAFVAAHEYVTVDGECYELDASFPRTVLVLEPIDSDVGPANVAGARVIRRDDVIAGAVSEAIRNGNASRTVYSEALGEAVASYDYVTPTDPARRTPISAPGRSRPTTRSSHSNRYRLALSPKSSERSTRVASRSRSHRPFSTPAIRTSSASTARCTGSLYRSLTDPAAGECSLGISHSCKSPLESSAVPCYTLA